MSNLLDGFGKYNNIYGNIPEYFNRTFHPFTLKQFIFYYLHNGHLSINYQNGKFKVGMPYFDFMIDISNAFIDFFNQHFTKKEADDCFDLHILYHTVVANGKFFKPNTSTPNPDVSGYIGKKVCTFKGQDITLRILEDSSEKPQKSVVLSHGLAMYILNNILKIINYRYTNEYIRQHCGDSTAALPAPTNQRVYYI